jgi:hypothetical protein
MLSWHSSGGRLFGAPETAAIYYINELVGGITMETFDPADRDLDFTESVSWCCMS